VILLILASLVARITGMNRWHPAFCFVLFKVSTVAGCWWLMPVILATKEAEIRTIPV
jgi:hypothetical protein